MNRKQNLITHEFKRNYTRHQWIVKFYWKCIILKFKFSSEELKFSKNIYMMLKKLFLRRFTLVLPEFPDLCFSLSISFYICLRKNHIYIFFLSTVLFY